MTSPHLLRAAIVCATLLVAYAGVAHADPSGVWLRDNGQSRIRIASCGAALCGTIVWLQTPRNDENNPNAAQRSRSLVGVRVFFDMRPNGDNRWSGQAYNPEDGRTYRGNMSLSGRTLTTQGCAFGGMICRSVTWSRVN
jgi:uncharacterized protein (DUF2147 family)